MVELGGNRCKGHCFIASAEVPAARKLLEKAQECIDRDREFGGCPWVSHSAFRFARSHTQMQYHICMTCNAKFFADVRITLCPRCGANLPAGEELDPPWQTQVLAPAAPSKLDVMRDENA